MADVKWIKLQVDIFNKRKIKQIKAMPLGSDILLMWFQLMCLAGEINDDGFVYITPEIPYTESTLATEFDIPIETVKIGINVFQKFGMVEIVDDFLMLSSWKKYQNTDGLEKIREQSKERSARYREKKRLTANEQKESIPGEVRHVTRHVTVTQHHATDKEIDIDKEIDKENKYTTHQKNNGNSDIEVGFDVFWKAYPRKVGKETARKAFGKVRGVSLETMLSALERQKRSEQWTKNGGQFIPNPSTWLNQGRWDDELSAYNPGASSGQKKKNNGNPFMDMARGRGEIVSEQDANCTTFGDAPGSLSYALPERGGAGS